MINNHKFLIAVCDSDLKLLQAVILADQSRDPEALHYAVQLGNPDVVALLLDSGWMPHINSFDDIAFTPLAWAAYYNHIEVVRLLLTRGADVNANLQTMIGNTTLREVVDTASVEMVQALIGGGADPSISGWMQLTALQKAEERVEDNPADDEARAILKLLKSVL